MIVSIYPCFHFQVLALKKAWDIDPHEVDLQSRVDAESEGTFGEVCNLILLDLRDTNSLSNVVR